MGNFSIAQNNNILPDTTGICDDLTFIDISQKIDKKSRIQWNDPYSGLIEGATRFLVLKKGKYYLTVTSGKTVIKDSTYVKVYPKPKLNLRDTILCKGKQLILDAKNPGMKYLWNTDETTQKIKVENNGTYWVKVKNNGCVQSDTMNVKFLLGATPNFNNEISFCLSDEHKVLSIKTAANTKILWSTGGIYPSINITKDGTYWVKTENKNCGEQVDSVKVILKACDCEMMIPNSFTPNEDNRNDYFFPVIQCEYTYYSLTILDKWGNTVFFTNSTSGKWDGRFKGNLCPEEVYVYKIESVEKGSDKKQPRSGKVSLFR
jgi:gliding motility-associated-like protein